jgi:hypothetical protein
VARALDHVVLGGAPERVRVRARETCGDVRVGLTPEDERRAAQLSEPLPRAREQVLRSGAVELQDRALGAVVEVGPEMVVERSGEGAGLVGRVTQDAAGDPLRREAHRELAGYRAPPLARGPVPAIARQQRKPVDDHEPLDPLRPPLREPEPEPGAPVIDHERGRTQSDVVRERLEEGGVAVDRVVEIGRLA